VADYVPAGIVGGVGEEGAGAGDVFFGLDGVNLVFGFVAFVGDGEQADAMDGGVGGTELGNGEAQVIPGDVDGVHNKGEENDSGGDAHQEASAGRRGVVGLGHGNVCRVYFALSGDLVEGRFV